MVNRPARRFENSFKENSESSETRSRGVFPLSSRGQPRRCRATTLALRVGPDVVVAAPKQPISVAPTGREARFGSERSHPCVPRQSRRDSFDEADVVRRNACVVASGTSRRVLDRETGAADGRDVREVAVPHARGGGHRCARAPGSAHAERDGRSEATPRSLQNTSASFNPRGRNLKPRSGGFFFFSASRETPSGPDPTRPD